jgi:hypothetical protein
MRTERAPEPRPADFNDDGGMRSSDFLGFLNAFASYGRAH